MATKDDLQTWVLEALKDLKGQGSIVEISRHIWEHRETDLRSSGDLFYTWQYDMRWAGLKLRKGGKLAPAKSRTPWTLTK